MPFCTQCGAKYEDSAKFCPSCGQALGKSSTDQKQGHEGRASSGSGFQESIRGFLDTSDTTDSFEKTDIEKNQLMAILAYLGILVIIPIVAAKDSRFARYHANQGLILLIAEFVWSVAASMSSFLFGLFNIPLISFLIGVVVWLISLVPLAYVIFGIYNAATGRARELPLIGKFKILQ